ncbi:LysM peptidoglycan-binding domain-containing protein [Arthrobacter antioxidans]|uniref:LysM peptidoglycan-binding domain-containing protein n=1 Tax=Arthrobacter antioxidans TaxID=2895818 RepID=UPI001FFE6244|nr:LysM domain-containing protein [Arthrobacter antioxidans]
MQRSDAIQAGMILGCGVALSGAGAVLLVGRRAADGPALEGVLGMALTAIGLAVVGVWVLLFVLAVLAELLGRGGPSAGAALASRCTPAVMRRLAAALLGVNLLAVPAMAQAASDDGDRPVLTATAADRSPASAAASESPDPALTPVSPAWKPERLQVDGGPLLRAESRTLVEAQEAVVAPGDSLWSIVAARLGPMATASDIAEAWPAWYDTNRAAIGDDPSLLLPGTVLQTPSG